MQSYLERAFFNLDTGILSTEYRDSKYCIPCIYDTLTHNLILVVRKIYDNHDYDKLITNLCDNGLLSIPKADTITTDKILDIYASTLVKKQMYVGEYDIDVYFLPDMFFLAN